MPGLRDADDGRFTTPPHSRKKSDRNMLLLAFRFVKSRSVKQLLSWLLEADF